MADNTRHHARETTDADVTKQCPHCAMPVSEGSNPTTVEGVTYCCQECANGLNCACSAHAH